MAELFQFDQNDGRGAACIACDAMLADALDQMLSEADQVWFDRHLATCAECSEHMADAQRGAAWLEMLKSPRPEPSAELMERILAQTSGATGAQPVTLPAYAEINPLPMRKVLPFRLPLPRFGNRWFEPRLAMTAAMAFFSVALTMNLTGVKLSQLHASDLKPSSLKRTYYEANAQVSRYYDNLRVVRVMESRVEDLRQANASEEQDRRRPSESRPEPQPAPKESKPADKPKPQDGPGMSLRETPTAKPQFLPANDVLSKSTKEGGLA